MTTQTIQFDAVSLTDIGSGAITAQLLDGDSNPMLAAIAESAVRGRYTGTVTDHAAGSFELLIFWGGKRVGRYSTVTLLAADGTYLAKDTVAAVLNTETSDKIDLILEDTGATIPALVEGISSGGTDWTSEQRTYILEQLALLTVSGASVVVTSGVYMCARGDVEQVYGNANTATWADLNNNQNSSEITSRINYHIAIADNYIRSVLTQGAWVMPVEGDTIPAILAYNCARLAGVLLYEGRGVTDYDPKGRAIHQLSNHKNGVDSFLKSVVYGSTDLSPLVKSSTNEAPTAS